MTKQVEEIAVFGTFITFIFALGLVMMFFGTGGILGGIITWIIGFWLFGWYFLWGAVGTALLGLAGLFLFISWIHS